MQEQLLLPIHLETFNGKPVYHITGEGKTNSSYDWIYKVKDKYETYIDTSTMQPLKFIRNVHEGGYKKYQNITFNKTANTAITNDGVFKVPGLCAGCGQCRILCPQC